MQDGQILENFNFRQFFFHNGRGFPDDLHAIRCHFTQDPRRQGWSGERNPVKKRCRQAQSGPHFAHPVLAQLDQGFDNLIIETMGMIRRFPRPVVSTEIFRMTVLYDCATGYGKTMFLYRINREPGADTRYRRPIEMIP